MASAYRGEFPARMREGGTADWYCRSCVAEWQPAVVGQQATAGRRRRTGAVTSRSRSHCGAAARHDKLPCQVAHTYREQEPGRWIDAGKPMDFFWNPCRLTSLTIDPLP